MKEILTCDFKQSGLDKRSYNSVGTHQVTPKYRPAVWVGHNLKERKI